MRQGNEGGINYYLESDGMASRVSVYLSFGLVPYTARCDLFVLRKRINSLPLLYYKKYLSKTSGFGSRPYKRFVGLVKTGAAFKSAGQCNIQYGTIVIFLQEAHNVVDSD